MSKLSVKYGTDVVTSGITRLIGVLTGNRQSPVDLATLARASAGALALLAVDVGGALASSPMLSLSPMDFGAKADGTDETIKVVAAITYCQTNNILLRGGENTYAVSGDLLFDGKSNIKIDGLKLKQLTPNDANRKTLYFHNCEALRLRNIVVDRNGLGSQGGLASAAGLWIYGGSDHRCDNLEAFGNGKGNGVVIQHCIDGIFNGLFGHDIAYDSPGATDDLVQGVWLTQNTNCVFGAPRARNLSGNPTGITPLRFTRGISMGGNTRCTLLAPKIESCDQGIDASSSEANADCQIIGGNAKNVAYWGVKLANTAVRCKVIGFTTENPGICGIVVAGPDATYTDMTADNDVIGCTTINAGTPYTGVSGTTAGFRIQTNSASHLDYPKGTRFINCNAIDNQGSPTMQYGYHCEVDYATNDHASKKLNELVNCKSSGHTVAMSAGFASWNVSLANSANNTLTNNTEDDLHWDTDVSDTGAQHDTVTNNHGITIAVDGLYRLDTGVAFASNATGYRMILIRKNGVELPGARVAVPAVNGDITALSATTTLHLVAGDFVSVRAIQTSGGNLNLVGSKCAFNMTQIQQS